MEGVADQDDTLLYPNPASGKAWTDPAGQVWQRRGNAHAPLDAKRLRLLMRRADVPMATWQAGDLRWCETSEEKEQAAVRLQRAAARPEDIVATEWKTQGGRSLLLLEHHC